jgi:hypothetical protein
MGPAPHLELQRLIDTRSADSSFVLDQLTSLSASDPTSPLAGHLDTHHVGIIGHSLGGATAVQTLAADPRFDVGIDLDGKLFGAEPDAHLKQPVLWVQSGEPKNNEYIEGRDRLFAGLQGGGALVTVAGSVHMGFSDSPSYWTAVGRSLVGGVLGAGAIPVADMTSMTADSIAAFVGPVPGATGAPNLDEVLRRHSAIRVDRSVAAKGF